MCDCCSRLRTVFPGWAATVKNSDRSCEQCSHSRTIAGVNAPRTARDRARAELTRDIKDVARQLIERDGAAALSLREVSREMGMGASTLYRYFRSRDELLTALIIDPFDQLAA